MTPSFRLVSRIASLEPCSRDNRQVAAQLPLHLAITHVARANPAATEHAGNSIFFAHSVNICLYCSVAILDGADMAPSSVEL